MVIHRLSALALALAAAGVAIAGRVEAQQNAAPLLAPLATGETLLQVVAHGTIKAVPDVATLSTQVSSDGADTEEAARRNAELATRLIAALRAAGVSEAAMRTEGLRVGPRFRPDKDGDDTDVVIGYRAETRLRIRVTDIALVSKVVDALTGAGATAIDGPTFTFASDAALLKQARAAAVAAANAQAGDYAAPFGLHVARVLRISERAARTDEGSDIVVTGTRLNRLPQLRTRTPPVLPGEQEVTADVWIDYALTR